MKIEILTEESTSFGIIEGGEFFGYGAINNVYLKMNNREPLPLIQKIKRRQTKCLIKEKLRSERLMIFPIQ